MLFKRWHLKAESGWGSPARVVLEKADAWRPDLIVVGSHGHSALGRLLLGSVSHKIVTDAPCSVRIARARAKENLLDAAETPVRLIIGLDGSPGAEFAVTAVAQRQWPAGTEAQLVTADFPIPVTVAGHPPGPLVQWMREERERIRAALAAAADTLQKAGLAVSTALKDERPIQLLCHTAAEWKAECIFVGANQMGRVDRLLLGSVSAGVAMRALCSVEIIRPT
jgi:nucleotide-binding universal stress UspA family protein